MGAIQNKHSAVSGRKPHLAPGQIGHNSADRAIFLRADGRVVQINAQDVEAGPAPTSGPDGAPLQRLADGLAWSADLAPRGVVGGVVSVDLPPYGGYGVPGVMLTPQAPETVALPAETLLVEEFHVASDTIRLSGMSLSLASGSGSIRVGVMDATGFVLLDRIIVDPPRGEPFTAAFDYPLRRGDYRAFLWLAEDGEVLRLRGLRVGQGFTSGEGDAPRFIASRRGQGAFIDGVDPGALLSPIEAEYVAEPGVKRALLLAWT